MPVSLPWGGRSTVQLAHAWCFWLEEQFITRLLCYFIMETSYKCFSSFEGGKKCMLDHRKIIFNKAKTSPLSSRTTKWSMISLRVFLWVWFNYWEYWVVWCFVLWGRLGILGVTGKLPISRGAVQCWKLPMSMMWQVYCMARPSPNRAVKVPF